MTVLEAERVRKRRKTETTKKRKYNNINSNTAGENGEQSEQIGDESLNLMGQIILPTGPQICPSSETIRNTAESLSDRIPDEIPELPIASGRSVPLCELVTKDPQDSGYDYHLLAILKRRFNRHTRTYEYFGKWRDYAENEEHEADWETEEVIHSIAPKMLLAFKYALAKNPSSSLRIEANKHGITPLTHCFNLEYYLGDSQRGKDEAAVEKDAQDVTSSSSSSSSGGSSSGRRGSGGRSSNGSSGSGSSSGGSSSSSSSRLSGSSSSSSSSSSGSSSSGSSSSGRSSSSSSGGGSDGDDDGVVPLSGAAFKERYSALVNHGPLHSSVPGHLRGEFVERARCALQELVHGPLGLQSTSLLSLLELPGRMLQRQIKHHNTQHKYNTRSKDTNINSCMYHIRNGHIRKAVQTLIRNNDLNDKLSAEEFINAGTKLHPQVERGIPKPPLGSTCPNIDLRNGNDRALFERCVRDRDNGSAPGPSGWTGRMQSLLVKKEETKQLLADFWSMMQRGEISEQCQDILKGSLLSLIRKDSSSDKRRPVAATEIFYRGITTYAVRQCKQAIHGIFAPIQLGMAKGGCERVLHTLQFMLNNRTSGRRKVAVTVDFTNAFNTVNRETMMHALYEQHQLSSIFHLAYWAYSAPSDLLFRDEHGLVTSSDKLRSCEGGKQGDTLSVLLFCLCAHRLYRYIAEKYHGRDGTKKVEVLAIVDDMTFVCEDVETAITVLDQIQSVSEEMCGLCVNLSKTSMINFHKDDVMPMSAEHRQQLADWGVRVHRLAAPLLGSVLGRTDNDGLSEMKALIMDAVHSHKPLFDRLKQRELPHQYAMIILQNSTSMKHNYINRTVLPHACEEAAQTFDNECVKVMTERMRIVATPEIRQQLLAPTKGNIGFGIHQNEHTHYLAYLSSLALTIAMDETGTFDPAYMSESQRYQVQSCLRTAARFGIADRVLLSQDYHEFYRVCVDKDREQAWAQGLQSRLYGAYCKLRLAKLRRDCDDRKDVAALRHIDAICADGCSVWLRGIPARHTMEMSDDVYVHACRLRLNLPFFDIMPATCPKCGVSIAHDQQHIYNCPRLCKNTRNNRHESIVHTLLIKATEANILVCKNLSHLFVNDSEQRPDLQIGYRNATDTLVDVMVTNDTRASEDSRTAAAVRDKAAAEKRARYAAMCAAHGMSFTPFIVSIHGACGKEAQELMRDMAVHAVNHGSSRISDYGEFMSEVRMEVAVRIQVGTYEIGKRAMMTCLHDSNRHAARVTNSSSSSSSASRRAR